MKTILVVDDEQSVAELLVDVLSEEGYRVVMALDGVEGLAQARALRPDLVISDMMMPKLDGRGLVQALHSDAELRHTPVLLMSAGQAQRGELNNKTVAFIPKPFAIEQIVALVRQLLS